MDNHIRRRQFYKLAFLDYKIENFLSQKKLKDSNYVAF